MASKRNHIIRLFEHPDFEQAIIRASEHFEGAGLRPSFIEKDYYVTEALRLIAQTAGDKVIFKGGTSLSKGWDLIQRFSEDIDIFLDPDAFDPRLGRNGIDRELRHLRDAVNTHPALTFLNEESRTTGGFGRSDRFSYGQKFGGAGEPANRILVEVGAASGRQPVEIVTIRSSLAQFLHETNASLGAEDEAGFKMALLHFRRTFVEKLFAIHGKVELLKRDGRPIGTYARHFYDLHQLALTPDVVAMLSAAEYGQIKEDYDRISKEHFERDYTPPPGLSFASSSALFPDEALGAVLAKEYEKQCRELCYGPYPSWQEVLATFIKLRDRL